MAMGSFLRTFSLWSKACLNYAQMDRFDASGTTRAKRLLRYNRYRCRRNSRLGPYQCVQDWFMMKWNTQEKLNDKGGR